MVSGAGCLLRVARPSLLLRGRKCLHAVQKPANTVVTEAQVEEYQQNGAICIRNVFDKYWLDLVDRTAQKNKQSPGKFHDWIVDDGGFVFFNDLMNFRRFEEYVEYASRSPAAEIAGMLMKSNLSLFFHEHLFYKDGGSTKETPWHQDQPYYPVEGMQNCSIWMPTTTVSLHSSVKFIKGSHRWGKYFHPRKFLTNSNYKVDSTDGASRYDDISTVTAQMDKLTVLSWETEPGDCIVFHMKTIHGTDRSLSSEKRVVLATRWLGEDAVFTRRPWETSPPRELLPSDLHAGDYFHRSSDFLIPWRRESSHHC